VKAYVEESAAGAAEATDKTQAPIKVPTDAPATGPAATDKTPAPIKVPAGTPANGPVDVPIVKSAGDIPPTISTTPPPDDAA
jgi:hypothetical protein